MHKAPARATALLAGLGGLLILAVSLALGSAAGATTPAATAVQAVPTPPPPPTPSAADRERLRQRLRGEFEVRLARGEFQVTSSEGPATRGSTVVVAGKPVRLPDDAWVEQHIDFIQCGAAARCPEPPVLVIRRGNSTTVVSARTGAVHREQTATGEESAFQFLMVRPGSGGASPFQFIGPLAE